MGEKFIVSKKLKRICYILMGAGILMFGIGLIIHMGDFRVNQRIWANILWNGVFFTGISVSALFFIAANTTGYAGWYVLIQRIMEAIAKFLPVAGIVMALVMIGAWTHQHHLYHWTDSFLYEQEVTVAELREHEEHYDTAFAMPGMMQHEHAEHMDMQVIEDEPMDEEPVVVEHHPDSLHNDTLEMEEEFGETVEDEPVTTTMAVEHHNDHGHHGGTFDPHHTTIPAIYAPNYADLDGSTVIANPHYDRILDGKRGFLNLPFWTLRMVLYFGLWIGILFVLRRLSTYEDALGGLKNYKRSKVFAAIFLIIFAVSSSTSSWDWVMSIDAHWFSTLFGWYNFASLLTAAFAVMILMVVFLKENGYLRLVNQEHLHDLGKFMFGFSVFWAYLWFSQFMLYWYGNLPEETIYFQQRIQGFPWLFYGVFIINFLFPFLVLMTRGSKRNLTVMKVASIVVILGHLADYYLMIMPGALMTTTKSGQVLFNGAGFGLIEIGLLTAMIGLFIFVVSNALSKASLVPVNHPFLGESIEHHT